MRLQQLMGLDPEDTVELNQDTRFYSGDRWGSTFKKGTRITVSEACYQYLKWRFISSSHGASLLRHLIK